MFILYCLFFISSLKTILSKCTKNVGKIEKKKWNNYLGLLNKKGLTLKVKSHSWKQYLIII